MNALRQLARTLLGDRTVGVVIGWEGCSRGVRPAFVTRQEDADRLVFDARSVHNLAVYLSPRRNHLVALGKKAIVVKGCDAKAVTVLVRENQIKREDVVLIGVRCGGVGSDPCGATGVTPENVARRCLGCDCREPERVDYLVGDSLSPPPAPRGPDLMRPLESASPADRWAFWRRELERCVRCYACREVCPVCFCDRCLADKSQPQWIDSSAHLKGNFAWQMVRMVHAAGRCVECGECARACPAGIPLDLILHEIARVVEDRFGYRATDDPAVPAPLGTFDRADPGEFIL